MAASNAALEERTRDLVPVDWALTKHHLGIAEIAYFDKTGDSARLDQAEAHLHAAREVFSTAGQIHYLGMVDARLAEIAARRR